MSAELIEILPHIVWASVAIAILGLGLQALHVWRRLSEAKLKPPEDVRREVAARIEQLEQRVTALDLRTRPAPKLRCRPSAT